MEAPPSETANVPPRRTAADDTDLDGLALLGVVWASSRVVVARWRARGTRMRLLKYRDVAALVRPVPYRVPEMTRAAVEEHQRELDRVMQRGAVLPAPFGIVFRDRHGVLRFLEEQHSALDRGLAMVEGRWEFRVHVRTRDPDGSGAGSGLPSQVYGELRKISRASMPFQAAEAGVRSAAFLVDRVATNRFFESVTAMGDSYPELTLDVTGPWPAYDFVVIRP